MKLTINLSELNFSIEGDLDTSLVEYLSGLARNAVQTAVERSSPASPVPAAEDAPEPSVPLSVVRSLVDAVLSYCGSSHWTVVVNLEGMGWAISRDSGVSPYWVRRDEAIHDIQCLLTNRDGMSVTVITVPKDGAVWQETLDDKDDFIGMFGSGSWK